MQKFNVKFSRDFEVGIEADTLALAELLAGRIIAEFPASTCRLLSIVPEEGAIQVDETTVKRELARPRFPGGIDDLCS
jgi:hypothetical protein